MARTNPVPEQEKEICKRFREVRLLTKLSRVAFSKQIEIDSSTLASYEHGRVPLRFDLAFKISKQFGVSLKWLAEGKTPQFLSIPIPQTAINEIPPKSLFSTAYDEVLRPLFDVELPEFPGTPEGRLKAWIDLQKEIQGWIASVPDAELNSFVVRLRACADELLEDYPELDITTFLRKHQEVEKLKTEMFLRGDLYQPDNAHHLYLPQPIDEPILKKNHLTEVNASVKPAEVKAQWPILKKRLQEATAAAGTKTKLAEFLGVQLASVSQWLTDSKNAREPGAETALRMLRWIEAQKVK